MRPARTKHSEAAIKRLIEQIISEECDTAPRGLALIVEAVELSGRPTELIRVWGTLHLTSRGSPYCCSEPLCLLGDKGRHQQICESLQTAIGVTQPIDLDMDRISANVHEGVEFLGHPDFPNAWGYLSNGEHQ